MLGMNVNPNDAFDLIEYSKDKDVSNNMELMSIFDLYATMDIYKLTGLSFNEFKQLTILEQTIILDYAYFKSLTVTDTLNNLEDNGLNNSNKNMLYDVSSYIT